MAQYDDLSKYIYFDREESNIFNIGWIEDNSFNRGKVKEEFITRLWEYIKYPVNVGRSLYKNEYLDNKIDTYTACYNGYQILLGAAEIRVMNLKKGVVYAAPNLIIHYILNHQYVPPEEFIEAVMNGPNPNSEEFTNMIVDVYKYKQSSRSSSLVCPYCGSNKNYFAPSVKKQFKQDSDIKVVKTSLIPKDNLKNNDNDYNVICEKCGKMFRVSFEDIEKSLKGRLGLPTT
ncbi:hypothetical protein [Lachnotalea glycerini]|uniref:DUF7919 domain-containing protein n=1 Tax=Lachnotalea glycerini TaxID=1763509 RepID=A0A371J1E6_9FIRM|nr:hypothetical protein [Lachnotalea glycerini]RDY26486.1 hypothetical protein CG710_021715 [Lachnotalea glycerini]